MNFVVSLSFLEKISVFKSFTQYKDLSWATVNAYTKYFKKLEILGSI